MVLLQCLRFLTPSASSGVPGAGASPWQGQAGFDRPRVCALAYQRSCSAWDGSTGSGRRKPALRDDDDPNGQGLRAGPAIAPPESYSPSSAAIVEARPRKGGVGG